VAVTGLLATATVWLGIQTWRAVRESAKGVREATRLADASERQLFLLEDQLRLVERQVAATERQLTLQESNAGQTQRRAFPVREVEATELATDVVKGKVYYCGAEDPAEDIDVVIWFRGGRYAGKVATMYPTPGVADFIVHRVQDPEATHGHLPGWALTRGPRVDGVLWRNGIRGEWWAQRYDDNNRPLGLPDRGEWWVEGVQRPGILG
jgi:hypothetical protein